MNRGASIPLRAVEGSSELLSQLAYPSRDVEYASRVATSLSSLGVEELFLSQQGGLLLIGKGFRNIVLPCIANGEPAAAKIRRTDTPVKDTSKEAWMLGLANRLGIGPLLRGYAGPVILMELLDGEEITTWLTGLGEGCIAEARRELRRLLEQCHALDAGGIDHGELSDATRHVVKTRRGLVIIDFGSARLSTRPANLTSILSYLFHGAAAGIAKELLGLKEPGRSGLRRYKERRSYESFREVLGEVFGW